MSSVERFETLQAYIYETIPFINTVIRRHLNSNVLLIRQISEYLIASGGKRLRPIVHVLVARACGYECENPSDNDTYTLGAILELIHSATLLHDDVVDHSELRRGHPTANTTFGNAASVLSGDFLYSRAFQMMVNLKNLTIMEILSSATNVIAEGEVLQLMFAGEAKITEAQYRSMIQSKTAKLFEASAELGAIISNKPIWQTCAANYGRHLGITFQLIDDLLDYAGHPDILGKNIGDDLEEGKWTLPLLLAFERSSNAEQERLQSIVQAKDREGLLDLTTILDRTGALEATKQAAQKEAEYAINALSPLPPSQHKDLLIELTHYAVHRSA